MVLTLGLVVCRAGVPVRVLLRGADPEEEDGSLLQDIQEGQPLGPGLPCRQVRTRPS
jgi:hypothetical protein